MIESWISLYTMILLRKPIAFASFLCYFTIEIAIVTYFANHLTSEYHRGV